MSLEPYLIAIYLSYFLMVWFFIASVLAIRSKTKTVLTSVSLFLVWSFYSYILLNYDQLMAPLTDPQLYEMLFWFDLVTAAIMAMWLKDSKSLSFVRTLPNYLRYDKLAWIYAIILLLTAVCHFFMLDDVVLLLEASKNSTKYTPSIMYFWYEELLILGQISQAMVASYGMVKSIRILNVLHQTDIDCSIGVDCYIESLQRQKEREART